MPITIAGEAELPETVCHFVRLKSDPRLLQHSRTGEIYVRADGKNWDWPGYTRYQRKDGTWEPAEGAGAYCGTARFPYTKASKAA